MLAKHSEPQALAVVQPLPTFAALFVFACQQLGEAASGVIERDRSRGYGYRSPAANHCNVSATLSINGRWFSPKTASARAPDISKGMKPY